jgi:TonB-linked SusC/RagA family outer membrane protein
MRIMKISLLLLFVLLMPLYASTNAQNQKVNIKSIGGSLKEVLSEIENQTELTFIYNHDVVNESEMVSIDVRNARVESVLEDILSDQHLDFKIIENKVMLFKSGKRVLAEKMTQEEFLIKGKVADVNGDPLPGVNVIEKGTTNGVITGVDGSYTIKVNNPDDVLIFSFIGFTSQEINVANRKSIDITLVEEVTGLDEVVVVAFGTQKKSHLSAAVQEAKGEVVMNRPIQNAAEGLAGQIAGLNVDIAGGAPNQTPSLNIRGFTGIKKKNSWSDDLVIAKSEPLVLIDGVERSLADINPNDIESFSVLKDGSSTAIYGSRAAYGAIIITTKSGKEGKMKVNYGGNVSVNRPINLPSKISSVEFAHQINQFRRNNSGGNGTAYFKPNVIDLMQAWIDQDWDSEVWGDIPMDQRIAGVDTRGNNWASNNGSYANNDWMDKAFMDYAINQQHNVNLSGGNKKTSYYVSFNYNERNGIFDGIEDSRDRYTVLTKIDTELFKWLNFNVSTNYVRAEEIGANVYNNGRDYGNAWSLLSKAWPNHADQTSMGGNYRFNVLPNFNGEAGWETYEKDDITVTGGLIATLTKGWKVNARYTWRANSSGKNRVNITPLQILPDGSVKATQRTSGGDMVQKWYDRSNYRTLDLFTSYDLKLGENNFKFMIGMQQEEKAWNRLYGKAQDYYSSELTHISTTSGERHASDDLYNWSTRGYFGRVNYNYKEKYFVEANYRKDATSLFNSSNQWATFPSLSAAWNIAKENFWPLADQVSLFKIRGSWSNAGDAGVNQFNGNYYPFYPSMETKVYNNNSGNAVILDNELASYVEMADLVSDELTWNKVETIDFGFDLWALQNRLSFTYDWYQRTIHDGFGPAETLPEVLGTAPPQANNSTTETRGWEFVINWKDKMGNLAGKPLNYEVGINYSDFISYIVDYDHTGTGKMNEYTPGMMIGQNYHYVSKGIAQNSDDVYANVVKDNKWYYAGDLMLADLNGDGFVGSNGKWQSMGDVKKNGFSYPRGTYGINLGLEWNNFDVSLMLDGVLKWKKYTNSHYVFGMGGDHFWSPFYREHMDLGYWMPDNTDAFFPRAVPGKKNTGWDNDQYALDLSHLRIRNLKVGYRFNNLLSNYFKSLYTYVSMENLGFIYNNAYVKYDPYMLAATNGGGYPPMSSVSFGLNVEF